MLGLSQAHPADTAPLSKHTCSKQETALDLEGLLWGTSLLQANLPPCLGMDMVERKKGCFYRGWHCDPEKQKPDSGQSSFYRKGGTLFSQPMHVPWMSLCHQGRTKNFLKTCKDKLLPPSITCCSFTLYGPSSKSPLRTAKVGALCLSPGSLHSVGCMDETTHTTART